MVLFRFSVYLLLTSLLFHVTISTTCSRLWMITSRRSLPPRFVFSVSFAVFRNLGTWRRASYACVCARYLVSRSLPVFYALGIIDTFFAPLVDLVVLTRIQHSRVVSHQFTFVASLDLVCSDCNSCGNSRTVFGSTTTMISLSHDDVFNCIVRLSSRREIFHIVHEEAASVLLNASSR